jgi:hypothetical protein
LIVNVRNEPEAIKTPLLEQLLLILRQQLNPMETPRIEDSIYPTSSFRESVKTDFELVRKMTKLYQSSGAEV